MTSKGTAQRNRTGILGVDAMENPLRVERLTIVNSQPTSTTQDRNTVDAALRQFSRKQAKMSERSIRLLGLICISSISGYAMGCSSGGDNGDTTSSSSGSGGSGGGGQGDPNVLVGSFQVKLIAPVPATPNTPEVPGSTAILGKVYDGPTPGQIIWEKALEEGACKLLTPRVPFCSTPCGGSAVCVENDQCQAYPLAHSAGTVTVKGLHPQSGGDTFSMEPIVNGYQAPAGVTLPYPAFSEGEAITFSASGDFYSPFTVASVGIAPLVFGSDMITVESGKPLPISWTAPGKTGQTRIYVKLDISHHGGTKGMIECDADDSGSLELPAALVTKLLELGVAGYPTIIVARRATGSTTITQGRVDLVISSQIEKAVVIPGLTSCTADTDCPMGQTCQSDLTCK